MSEDSAPQAAKAMSDEQVVTFPTRPLGDIPVVAYIDPIDQQIASTGLPVDGRYEPCTTEQVENGETVIVRLPIDQCVAMEDSKLWRGRWLNGFEHSSFCPTLEDGQQCNAAEADIWLERGPMEGELGESYSVSFIGRKTKYPGGYGHMGHFGMEIIVERVIAIEKVASSND